MGNGDLAPPAGQTLFNTTNIESTTPKFFSFKEFFVMFLKEVSYAHQG